MRAADLRRPRRWEQPGPDALVPGQSVCLSAVASLLPGWLHRHDTAGTWLDEAAGLAGRVADDMRGNWQYFSATNVAIWRLVINVERGDSAATPHLASAVRPENLTVRCRTADFLAETGRGLAREQRTRAQAVT